MGSSSRIRVLDAPSIDRSLTRIAHEIIERNKELRGIGLVGVQTRGVPLARRLASRLSAIEGKAPPVGVLDINLYRDDLSRIGDHPVLHRTEIPFDLDDVIVILVDEVSQSQAEYTTMAFRVAPGARVVGSTTAGADGNVSAIPLPGGLRSMISGLGVFYPDKKPTQRVGIVPDIEARPTIAGIRAGRDEALEAGLREILGSETPAAEIEKLARK
jgi:hypothetical protein